MRNRSSKRRVVGAVDQGEILGDLEVVQAGCPCAGSGCCVVRGWAPGREGEQEVVAAAFQDPADLVRGAVEGVGQAVGGGSRVGVLGCVGGFGGAGELFRGGPAGGEGVCLVQLQAVGELVEVQG